VNDGARFQRRATRIIADFDALEPLSFTDPQGQGFLSSSVTPGPLPLPTPEPATWVMLTLGFIGIGMAGRRRLSVRASS
jgi:PEP-CTERM motif